MAGLTLEQAQAQLAAWLAAVEALATAQSYTISTNTGSRTLTRANLKDARAMVEYWDGQVKRLSAPASRRRRTRYVIPD